MGAASASAPGNIEHWLTLAPGETAPRPPFTNRKCRAQAASAGPWRFASCRASGSAGRLQSRRRSRLCRGPTVRRQTHCIAPRNNARQGRKFDARRRTALPQLQRLMFQDTAPAHTPNVSPCDSPLPSREAGFDRRYKPDCEFRPRNRLICAQAATGSSAHGCQIPLNANFRRSLKLIVYEEGRR